ncbi:MAG: TauD/TfdA family dioxygenase [Pseudomonadota bacterium]
MGNLNIAALNGVGAEITGVDLARELDDGVFAEIKNAFANYGVIFFRDQSLNETDHIAFAKRWGTINVNRFFAAHEKFPEIALVAKEPDQTDNIGGGWHTDHSYDTEPAMGSILVARVLPESGGDTLFASMYSAYEALDDRMKDKLEGLRAVHSAKRIFGEGPDTYYTKTDAGGGRIGNTAAAEALQDVSHPVVLTHPLSERKALYVNPAFTIAIEGMDKAESDELLSDLYAHCMNPAFTHRFQWRPGSIAFWDNRATWHWAKNDYHGQRRVMHRITIEGCALH